MPKASSGFGFRIYISPLFLAGLVLLPVGCGRKSPAPIAPVVVRAEAARPAADALQETRSSGRQTYLGLIRGDTETDLSFRIGGIIERIGDDRGDWREGQPVAAGTLLARLQQTELKAAFDQASARFEFEVSRLTNNAKLFADKAISQQEWESIQTAHRSAAADLQRARQALEDSSLIAAQAGTILARLANAGETVAAGRPVLRLGDLRRMKIELGVPDSVVSRVRVGQEIRLSIPALEGQAFVGKVSEVGVAAKEGTRLFKVVLEIPNADGRIKSGMTASVPFADDRPTPAGAVLVPLSALVTDTTSRLAVFVVGEDHRARLRAVKTDDILASSVIVTEGLQAGERVVVAGAGLLHDGALVEVR